MEAVKQVSLKRNFAYKGLLTVATPLMGIITFPYISRILGVENVGLVNFVDNTINYFLLFATLGIGTLGVRSIAAAKHSKEELDRTFSNILGLNLLFTLIVLVAYNIIIASVPRFSEHVELFYIGSAKILFTALMIEWFYNGIEDFKYITIRSLLVKAVYVISVFLFIKSKDDYALYFLMTVLTVVINSGINLIHSRKYVKIIPSELISTRFLKEDISLGIYAIMTSMYLTFNVMFLGLVSNNIEVGYYSSAYKLYHLILTVFGAFTSVMMPRMSVLAREDNKDHFNRLVDKSVDFIALFSIPLIICCCIMTPEIIYILCGKGYDGAVLPMRIIMPALLPVGFAHVLAMQVIVPLKKDKVLLVASISGALMSVILNLLLTKTYQSIGSAVVLLVSESVLTIIYIIYLTRNHVVNLKLHRLCSSFLRTLPCAAVCLLVKAYIINPYVSLTVSVTICVGLYFLLNVRQFRNLLK